MLDVGELLYLLLPVEVLYGGGCQPAPVAIFNWNKKNKFDALDMGKMKLCVIAPALLRLDLIYAFGGGGREGGKMRRRKRERRARVSRNAHLRRARAFSNDDERLKRAPDADPRVRAARLYE